jgi:hypothetical protein
MSNQRDSGNCAHSLSLAFKFRMNLNSFIQEGATANSPTGSGKNYKPTDRLNPKTVDLVKQFRFFCKQS